MAAAIDELLLKKDDVGPDESVAAALALTPTAKQRLLASADRGFLHWPVGALLEGWGMADPDVAVRLNGIAWGDARRASEIGHLLPRIILEPSRCRQRLLDLARTPNCWRTDFVVDGLRQVGIPPEQTDEAVEAIMGAIPDRSKFDYPGVVGGLFRLLPHHPRVRRLAEEEICRKEAPLAAIAVAYADDEQMRRRIMEVANPLPTELRLQIATHLSEQCQDRPSTLSVLGQYSDEENDAVSVQASIGYHSHLAETAEGTTDTVERLSREISCYGVDHDERRRAAFCGLVILNRLDIMKAARETIGNETRCRIGIGWDLHPNIPLCRFICENWGDLRKVFGDELVFRLSGDLGRSEAGLWKALAPVADEFPRARDEALSFLESARQSSWGSHELDAAVLRFLSRTKPQSSLLLDYCLKALFEDRDGTLGALERVVVAAEIVGEHFRGRSDVLARIVPEAERDWVEDSAILPLCAGWPESPELEKILSLLRKQKRPRISLASHIWLRCLTAGQDAVVDFLRMLLADYSTFWGLQYAGTSRPIVRRLATDDALFALVLALVKSSSSPAERVTFARLISAARPGHQEFREWCLHTLESALAGRHVVEVGFDLTVNSLVPLPHVLMDILHKA